MAEMMRLILELSSSVKEMLALVLVMKRSRLEQFHQSWIDSEQLMSALKISKRNLQSMRESGILPYSRLSGKYFYRVNDIEEILNRNYYQPTKINSK